MTLCSWKNCVREAGRHASGLCWAHYRRKLRGQPMDAPIRAPYASPWGRILQHAVDLGLAETDEEFLRAEKHLRDAVRAYREPVEST